MTEDHTHDEEDEGYAKHMDVGDSHQGRNAHARVDLSDLGKIFITIEIGNVRIATAVAGKAALVNYRLDVGIVFGLVEAVMQPCDDHRALVRRQHPRHRS